MSDISKIRQMLNSLKRRFLYIDSNDREVIRKGHLVQFLVLLLAFVNLGFLFFSVIQIFFVDSNLPLLSFVNPGLFFLFPLLCVSWWLARNGRIRRASHLFAFSTILVFFVGFVRTGDATVPYMMLMSVVAIAVLDSVYISTLYALVTTVLVITTYAIMPGNNLIEMVRYLLSATGIAVTVWMTARDLSFSVMGARKLNRDIFNKNSQLQRNASLLQLSAEVAQLTGQSLDPDVLLQNSVNLIRDRFGFYYVAVYLLDEAKTALYLREATGSVGEALLGENHHIRLEEASLTTAVIKTGKPQLGAPIQHPHLDTLLQHTRAELALPLVSRGVAIGVLDLHSRTENIFQDQDIAIFEILANQIAVNIDNARLYAQSENRFIETKTLFDLNNYLAQTFDAGEIYRRAAAALTTHLQAVYCRMTSWHPEESHLRVQVIHHPTLNETNEQFISLNRSENISQKDPSYETLMTKNAWQHAVDDEYYHSIDQPYLNTAVSHYMLELPLIHGQNAIGLATLYRPDAPFTPAEIQFGQAIANQTAVVLTNAILTSNTRGQLAQFRSLLRLSNVLSSANSLEEIYHGSRREILSLVEATGIAIMLVTPDGEALDWVYAHEFGQELDISKVEPAPFSQGFSGHVARTKEILYLEKTPEVIEQYDSFSVGSEKGFWVGLPLLVSTKLIGILVVESAESIDEKEIALLETISGPLGIAINNLRQLEEIQHALAVQSQQRVQLQTAAKVAASATRMQSLDQLLQTSVDLIKEQFDLYYVGLFLLDDDGHQAILRAGTGDSGQKQIEVNHQLSVGGQSLIGGTTHDGTPRITQDVLLDDEWRKNEFLPDTRSELALTLRVPQRIIGALTVQSTKPNVFDDALIDTLQTMADQLAVAIENIRLLEATRIRAANQQWLNDVSTRLHQSADVEQIVKIGLESLSERFDGTAVTLKLGRENRSVQE